MKLGDQGVIISVVAAFTPVRATAMNPLTIAEDTQISHKPRKL